MPGAKEDKGIGLALLGGWRLDIQGQAAGPAYEKGRALLAYLALEDRWHSRDRLGAMFWPDSPGQRANLRQVLSNLRSVLNDKDAAAPFLLVERQAVRFNPDYGHFLDVAAFTGAAPACGDLRSPAYCLECTGRMEAMVSLYRGEFLAGLSLADCPEFEDWTQFRRESLHRHALALLARLADCHAQAGNPGRALGFARRYVELEPWDEPGQRRVMHLYAATGQRLAALQQYDAFAHLLQAELGVQPEAETGDLYRRLRTGHGGLPEEHPSLPPPLPAPTLPAPAAERRQVTVLYCELTVMAGGDDPEEVMERLRQPQRQAVELIRGNGGHVVQAHGGGLLAYFGYPQAMENAAQLALRTAQAIAQRMALPIRSRCGVHTGLIVTGDDPGIPDAVGETSGLAVRLRLLCEAGEIAVSAICRRMAEGYFHFASLGVHALRDGSKPLEVFRLLGPSGASGRLEAASRLSPFIGREAELAQLAAFWGAARQDGCLQAMLLRGEPGMGKSRLLWQFKESLGGAPLAIRELRCLPEYSGTSLHPLTEHLIKVCGFTPADDNGARLDRLECFLAAHYPDAGPQASCLLARLLGLATEERYGPLALSLQQEREQLQALLLGLVATLAAQQPTLLIAEDLHWADPSTLEMLARLLAAPPAGTVGVLLTARPEFQPPWAQAIRQLDLGPLSPDESAALAAGAGRDRQLAAEVVGRVVRVADGVPLFIEEMTRILERGQGSGRHGGVATHIPTTLQDLLMARIDQLGDAKSLAQAAAVIGREFSRDLLLGVVPQEPQGAERALVQLVASGLVQALPGATGLYQFKHALIQEAAYQSQSRQSRREAHRRIAQALVPAAEKGEEAAEVVARHFQEAGAPEAASSWWFKAGSLAAAKFANAEAAEHFNRALAAVAALPDGRSRDELELQILVEQGAVLVCYKGYGSLEADRAYSRALELSERTGASLGLFRAIWGLYLGCSSRTHHSDAMEVAGRMLRLATQDGRPEWLIAAHYACANSAYSLGRFAQSLAHVEAARRAYEPELDEGLLSLFGEHVLVSALFFGAWALWSLGRPEEGREMAAEALAIAQRTDHPHTLGFAYCFCGVLHRLLDEPAQVAVCADSLRGLAESHDFAFWQVVGELLHGWALAAAGEAEGVSRIAGAIEIMRAGVFTGAAMYFLEMLAEAYGSLGLYGEQLRVIEEAVGIMEKIHDCHFEAELYRLKGECLWQLSGNAAEAGAWLQRALEVAQTQGSPMLEKRATASLARLEQVAPAAVA